MSRLSLRVVNVTESSTSVTSRGAAPTAEVRPGRRLKVKPLPSAPAWPGLAWEGGLDWRLEVDGGR